MKRLKSGVRRVFGLTLPAFVVAVVMTVWLVGVQVHAWFRPSSPWGITLWVAFVLAFVYGVQLIFNTLRRAERLEGAAKDFEASAAELTELIADLKAAKAQASTEAG